MGEQINEVFWITIIAYGVFAGGLIYLMYSLNKITEKYKNKKAKQAKP